MGDQDQPMASWAARCLGVPANRRVLHELRALAPRRPGALRLAHASATEHQPRTVAIGGVKLAVHPAGSPELVPYG